MKNGSIQKTILLLLNIFKALDVQVSLEKIEQIAIMVHKAMTLQARNYHTLEHVFSLIDSDNPIQNLAALYHDIVYYQVDRFLIPEINSLISPFVKILDENHFLITDDIHDRTLSLVLDVFNFRPGQVITPQDGSNEFLSALVMGKNLEGILSDKYILIGSACIEATIPFRGQEQKNHPLDLEKRLRMTCEKRNISISIDDIYAGIAHAVQLANKDVGGFCVSDPALFLNDTWKLLPETNVSLRVREYYSVKEYRSAIQKMEAFFCFLKPEYIFQTYRNEPPIDKLNDMIQAAGRNIETARLYLGIKLVGIACIEALADITGGDAPISLFMGEIEELDGHSRIEDYLPMINNPDWLDTSSAVFQLLEYGRTDHTNFDMKNSPLSSYLYKGLGPEKINRLLALAKLMFSGQITPREFLDNVDKNVLETFIHACSSLAITRRNKIISLL